MQPKKLKNCWSLWISLTFSTICQYMVKLDAARAIGATQWQLSPDVSNIASFSNNTVNSHEQQIQTTQVLPKFLPKTYSQSLNSTKIEQSDLAQSIIIVQSTPEQPKDSTNPQKPVEPPQVEAQPNEPAAPTPTQIEQRLDKPDTDYSKRLERLMRLLEKNKQSATETSNGELGQIIAKPQTSELGTIVAKPRQVEAPPLPTQPQQPAKTPPKPFEPIGYLLGRVSFFQTNNLFASKVDPIEDGLVYSGVTLASTSLQLAPRTFLSGSFDANVIRYISQSEFNYNQIRLNVDLYQQLTRRMYGEIGWSNQQLFYARNSKRFGFASGDRFLNENSFHLSLGRRDFLAPSWALDSFYEFRWNLAEVPQRRDRITNSLWLSLSYYLQQSLNVGFDYQLTLSDSTLR